MEGEADKRVLVVTLTEVPTADRHGAAVTAIVKALGRHFAVDVVCLKDAEHAHMERFHRARILRVPLGTGSPAERVEVFRRAVRRQLEGDVYDAVHVRGLAAAPPVVEWRAGGRGKLVIEFTRFRDTVGGLAPASPAPPTSALPGPEELRVLRAADVILVPSRTGREFLTSLDPTGIGPRIEYAPLGVDVDHFDWEPETPSDKLRVLYLGPLTEERDFPLLVEALRVVATDVPLAIRCVGDLDAGRRGDAKKALARAGLLESAEIFGRIDFDAVPAAIAWCDVAAVTASNAARYTRAGDYPLALLQVLACKRAAIAARLPAVEEIVRDGEDALLYPPGDAGALAEALRFLHRSARHRRRLAERGYERVRAEFAASGTRRRLRAVYKKLLDPEGKLRLLVDDIRPSDSQPSVSLADVDTLIFGSGSSASEVTGSPDTSPAAVPVESTPREATPIVSAVPLATTPAPTPAPPSGAPASAVPPPTRSPAPGATRPLRDTTKSPAPRRDPSTPPGGSQV